MESTGEPDRKGRGFADPAAEPPVMGPPRSTELFNLQRGIPGIQQEGIHMGRDFQGLFHRTLIPYMDHLDQLDVGQGGPEQLEFPRRDAVHQLE